MRHVPADGVRRFCLIELFPASFYVHGECTQLQKTMTTALYPHCIASVAVSVDARNDFERRAFQKFKSTEA
jgi:hypothetical protein